MNYYLLLVLAIAIKDEWMMKVSPGNVHREKRKYLYTIIINLVLEKPGPVCYRTFLLISRHAAKARREIIITLRRGVVA